MYGVVLLAALTASEKAPSHGWVKSHGYGVCYGSCYGAGYTGWPHYAGGWGLPYGGYWAGYACWGGCGGYESRAFGMHTPTMTPAPTTYAPVDSKSEEPKKDNADKKDVEKGKSGLDDIRKMDKDGAEDVDKYLQARAELVFELPRGAALFVDGTRIERADERKSFRTPLLEKGERYYYDLRVEMVREGKTYVENKRVSLSAGDVIKTNFTSLGTGTTTGVATVTPAQ